MVPLTFEQKTAINARFQELYEAGMQEGKHGHFETMFSAMHQAYATLLPTLSAENVRLAELVGELRRERDAALNKTYKKAAEEISLDIEAGYAQSVRQVETLTDELATAIARAETVERERDQYKGMIVAREQLGSALGIDIDKVSQKVAVGAYRKLADAEARAEKAERERDEALKANSTRPDYDLRCDECGRAHILDTSLPSDIWNQIAEPGNVLCTICIDRRLADKGLKAEAEFYFVGKALLSRLYSDETATATLARMREALEAATELAEYASYAEIVGGIRENRAAIRKWCDKVFELNRAAEADTALGSAS